jgi:hypothetical protein
MRYWLVSSHCLTLVTYTEVIPRVLKPEHPSPHTIPPYFSLTPILTCSLTIHSTRNQRARPIRRHRRTSPLPPIPLEYTSATPPPPPPQFLTPSHARNPVFQGDPLISAIVRALPGAARGYAVQYPANMNFSVSPDLGSDDTVARLNRQHRLCPEQTFALVGYSQGAAVMHSAAANGQANGQATTGQRSRQRPRLEDGVVAKIRAVVMFGDPGFMGTVGPDGGFVPPFEARLYERLRQNCAKGDLVSILSFSFIFFSFLSFNI